MKPKRKSSAASSRRAAALSFLLFGLIALAIVGVLEFLDFRAGKYSFIFDRVLRIERREPAAEGFERDLGALLAGQKIARNVFRDRAGVVHYRIDLAEPLYAPLARDLRRLVEKHGGLQLLSEVQGMKDRVLYLYQVRFGRRLTHVILIGKRLASPVPAAGVPRAPGGATPPAARARPPRLAIIIDDVGYADLVSGQLSELGIPLTAAVIPDAPFAGSEARRLHDFGLEAIIHLPMQPKDPANHHPRDQFVLVDSGADEIRVLLDRAMAAVPHARGVNNHMGSLLTSDPAAMRRVLEEIRGRGLFFVDSKTAPTTIAHALAREMKVRTALRDVFLDDVQTYGHASAQIRRLVEIAREKGRALAIGHPFPTTLAALRDAVPWLRRQKVEIVPVSQILE